METRTAPRRLLAHRHPARVSRVKARARHQRGVAVLEAAFVTPVFFLLIFGILEAGLAMNDNLALASSVRAGSREASASGNDISADLYTVLGVGREASAIDRSSIVRIVIYRPAGFGEGPTTACKNGTPSQVCNVYSRSDLTAAGIQVKEMTAALAQNRTPDPAKMVFGCKTTSPDRFWCPNTRNVQLNNPLISGYQGPDYVGVWMRVDHQTVTKVFGDLTFDDQSVIRLEPRTE